MKKPEISETDKMFAVLASQNRPSAILAVGVSVAELLAGGFSVAELLAVGVSVAQLRAGGFTASSLRDLEKDMDSIPLIPKIYTRLLAEIEAGQRCHKQSTFGPSDPPANVCGMPMCTAGHLVNLCGKAGYELKAKYGWETSAGLIHVKNRPDVPPQNFGAIKQEWALAYIKVRAAEEAKATP